MKKLPLLILPVPEVRTLLFEFTAAAGYVKARK